MNSVKTIDRQRIVDSPMPESPPSSITLFAELRALRDVSSVPLNLLRGLWRKKANKVYGRLPIITLPGFGSDERYMKPLEIHLSSLGYRTEGWGLGLNLAGINMPHALEELSDRWELELYEGYSPEEYAGEGGVPYLCDRAVDQIRKRSDELGTPVILICWSLGGYVAREVARDLPEEVAHVITLGAPVVGGPKYTSAANVFKKKGFNLDWIESESGKRDRTRIQQPLTIIYSKTDGVVDWRAALDKASPNATHLEVDVPHLGMGFNRHVWGLIEESLQRHSSPKSSAQQETS